MPKVLKPLPNRSYEVPGGPIAKDLGEQETPKLSDFDRGGSKDYRVPRN